MRHWESRIVCSTQPEVTGNSKAWGAAWEQEKRRGDIEWCGRDSGDEDPAFSWTARWKCLSNLQEWPMLCVIVRLHLEQKLRLTLNVS